MIAVQGTLLPSTFLSRRQVPANSYKLGDILIRQGIITLAQKQRIEIKLSQGKHSGKKLAKLFHGLFK